MIRTPMDDVLAGGNLAGDGIINAYVVNLPTALLRPLSKKYRQHQRQRVTQVTGFRFLKEAGPAAIGELHLDYILAGKW